MPTRRSAHISATGHAYGVSSGLCGRSRRLAEPPARCTMRCRSLPTHSWCCTAIPTSMSTYAGMRTFTGNDDADATLLAHPNDHPQDSDLVEIDDHGFVTALHPYPHPKERDNDNLANAALYVVEKHALAGMAPRKAYGGPREARFPCRCCKPAADSSAMCRPNTSRTSARPNASTGWTATSGQECRNGFLARTLRSAVFLDRDGTLNRDVHHLGRPEQLELLEGAADALRRLNRSGHLAVVITNQSAVARGDVTPDGLERIHARLDHALGARRLPRSHLRVSAPSGRRISGGSP